MDSLTLQQITTWTGGSLIGDISESVIRVVTDSRQARPGDLFVALQGDRFDAHDFLNEVAASGVRAALVQKGKGPRPEGLALVEVDDTLVGLQKLAATYRKTLPVQVVGITGSNGKTSTKDFTFAVLSQRLSGCCTQGNLNNHIGVPLTLLALERKHQVAVVEMGMNHAGEIAPLALMAQPSTAIITNVGIAHIEHLLTRDAIAEEKGSLARAVPASGTVVLNAEDAYSQKIASMTEAQILTAGIDCGDVQAVDLLAMESGTRFALIHEGDRVEVELPVPGKHMVRNAALAAAAGVALGIPLEAAAAGLRGLSLTHGRLESRTVGGFRFLDDSYNANPDSMEAALATLRQMPVTGRRVAVLGRMGELGSHAEEGHRKVGAAAAFYGVDWLLTVGSEADWISEEARKCGVADVDHFPDVESAALSLAGKIAGQDLVLVKGSRSARMERIIAEVARV